MPQYSQPYAFQCSCGKTWKGRPAYYRMQAHLVASGHTPKNSTTNSLPGKKRTLGSV